MDQLKIGKFISERRKAQEMTQMQLAENLGITDRAVSKWETGRSLPDASIMLDLCAVLGISVNDLLSGEVIMENYNKEMEKKIVELVKQKEESDRRLLALEWVIGIFSVIMLIIPVMLAGLLTIPEWQRVALIFAGLILCIIGICFAIRIEQVAGYYQCKHCGHKYVPTFKAVTMAMHMGRTRYMRCPECHKRSWQKKVISKD